MGSGGNAIVLRHKTERWPVCFNGGDGSFYFTHRLRRRRKSSPTASRRFAWLRLALPGRPARMHVHEHSTVSKISIFYESSNVVLLNPLP